MISYHDCYLPIVLHPIAPQGYLHLKLLMGRNLKSRFDLLKPNIAFRVEQRQQQQKHSHDSHAISRTFQEGDAVYAQDF